MKNYHKADHELAPWLNDLAEGKIVKKASSRKSSRQEDYRTANKEYGFLTRADQLGGETIEELINQMEIQKEKPEEKLSELGEFAEDPNDPGDLEAQIDQASTPEELDALEAKINQMGGDEGAPAEGAPGASNPTEGGEELPSEVGNESPITEDGAEVPASGGDSGSIAADPSGNSQGLEDEVGVLKTQIEEIKTKLDESIGVEQIKKQVDDMRKKLDDLNVPDDANLNDSIFQSASVINHAKRLIRRANGVLKNVRKAN